MKFETTNDKIKKAESRQSEADYDSSYYCENCSEHSSNVKYFKYLLLFEFVWQLMVLLMLFALCCRK